MRRRTLLLAAGSSAYFIGATVRAYLSDGPEQCSYLDAGCRIAVRIEHPRAALRYPLRAIELLVAPVCS